jgi:Zn-dependent metalloprotease
LRANLDAQLSAYEPEAFFMEKLDVSFYSPNMPLGSHFSRSHRHPQFEHGGEDSHYQNASWMGDKVQQMVYGDGGGDLYNFTACLDIIGHEMTVSVFIASSLSFGQPSPLLTNRTQHAVIEHTCGLRYEGEPGALNEHLADVFGMLVTLWSEQKTSAQSDWLIGEGCLMPGVKGVALRNMKFPGTAYDDPKV